MHPDYAVVLLDLHPQCCKNVLPPKFPGFGLVVGDGQHVDAKSVQENADVIQPFHYLK